MPDLMALQFNTVPPTVQSGQQALAQGDAQGRLLVTPSGGGAGSITWGAPTAVPNVGSASTTLVAALATRKAIIIWNPVGNAQMGVDIAGGTASLATGLPLLAGASLALTGADCPVGAITFDGTAAESLVYQQGT
jgi:hypothetical protein